MNSLWPQFLIGLSMLLTASPFARAQVPDFTLTARFSELVAVKGQDNAKDLKVPAVLSYQEDGKTVVLDAQLSLRGNTSLADCDFPKMKLKFTDRVQLAGTKFENMREFKIGTHCGEAKADEPTLKGRLANQLGPLRESFAYELLRVLQIESQMAETAEISYIDPSTDNKAKKRHALIIETLGDAAKRLGAVELKYASLGEEELDESKLNGAIPFFSAEKERADMPALARTLLFEALIHNFDHSIRVNDFDHDIFASFWNFDAVEFPDGHRLILPTDFDLATSVTGFVMRYRDALNKSGDEEAVLTELMSELVNRVALVFEKDIVVKQVEFFRTQRPKIEEALAKAKVDTAGKEIFLRHFSVFYQVLDTVFGPNCDKYLQNPGLT